MSNGTEREEADMEMRARAAMYALAKAMKCDGTALEVLAKATNLILAAQSAGFIDEQGNVRKATAYSVNPVTNRVYIECEYIADASPSQVGRGEGVQ